MRRQPGRLCIANSAAFSSLASTHKGRVTEIRTGHERCLLAFERGHCAPTGAPYQVVASHSPIILAGGNGSQQNCRSVQPIVMIHTLVGHL